jgi:branched-subunit amino acid aminotransferase/4-amino-4-deoxychorismate lyase
VPVAERSRTPAELDGREAWLVNALHGIRPVRSWSGFAGTAGPAVRAAAWQLDLEALAEPLS